MANSSDARGLSEQMRAGFASLEAKMDGLANLILAVDKNVASIENHIRSLGDGIVGLDKRVTRLEKWTGDRKGGNG